MPTRKSWPTRWATVIRAKTLAGQEGGCRDGAGLAAFVPGTPPPAAGPGAEVLEGADGSEGLEGPEARPHPEHARTSASMQPIAAPTVLRLTIPPRFQIVIFADPQIIIS
jgi:hypothetical protein